ncbi:MAG: ATP-binding protein [Chitinophagaceae bacterium]
MHAKKFLLLIISIASLVYQSEAQTKRIDSLKDRVALAGNKDERLNLLQQLCRLNTSMPADTLHLYATEALQLAQQQKDKAKIWESEYIYAVSLQQRSLTDSSLMYCNKLLTVIGQPSKNFLIYNEVLGLKATCLQKKNQIKEATSVVYGMLANAEKYNDIDGQINAYNLLTVVRGQLNNFDDPNATDAYLKQCIIWYRQAMSLFKDSSYYKKYDRIIANLGMTYFQLPKSKNDSAFYFINMALHYAQEQNQLRLIASCFGAKGNIFYTEQQSDSAAYYYEKETELRKQIGDPEGVAISFGSLRNVFRQKKDYKKALSYDLMGMDYCRANHMMIDVSQYEDLAEDYKSLGNYKAYGETFEQLVSVRDSLYQANSATALAEIQTKYETQKKEATIIRQQYDITRKNYWIYGFLAALAAIFIIVFILFKNRQKTQQLKLQEMSMEHERKTTEAINNAKEEERQRILADLHDDVGGGLSSIRMVSDLLSQQHEQVGLVNEYAQKISGITKEVTQRMNVIVWALNSENDTLQNLCEYIRQYGYTFFEDSAIQFESILLENLPVIELSGLQRKDLFLCVKEALNNILKHSLAKNAWVKIALENKQLTIEIIDNGKGLANENQFGNGLKSMQKRMREIGGSVSFETNKGTQVRLVVTIMDKQNTGNTIFTTS